MAEYIEREALMDEICMENCNHAFEELCPNCYPVEKILEAHAADVVEVVRCKDCKSYRLFKNRFGVEISRCMLIGADVGSDDYCSYGERKDGDG